MLTPFLNYTFLKYVIVFYFIYMCVCVIYNLFGFRFFGFCTQ